MQHWLKCVKVIFYYSFTTFFNSSDIVRVVTKRSSFLSNLKIVMFVNYSVDATAYFSYLLRAIPTRSALLEN